MPIRCSPPAFLQGFLVARCSWFYIKTIYETKSSLKRRTPSLTGDRRESQGMGSSRGPMHCCCLWRWRGDMKYWGQQPWGDERHPPLRAKETETSVPCLRGSDFRWQPEWAWNGVLPWASRSRPNQDGMWIWARPGAKPWEQASPDAALLGRWAVGLWGNKWKLFSAAKLLVHCHAGTESWHGWQLTCASCGCWQSHAWGMGIVNILLSGGNGGKRLTWSAQQRCQDNGWTRPINSCTTHYIALCYLRFK